MKEFAHIPLDSKGFLVNLADWTPELAEWLAAKQDIQLGSAHWEIIQLVRHFYAETGLSPINRVLVKQVRQHLGSEKGNSIYLMGLFPGSPARQVSLIAGLPCPANCL